MFEKNSAALTTHPNFGPNRKYYCHPFLSYSFFLPSYNGAYFTTIPVISGQTRFGLRNKVKITKSLALLSDFGISRRFFRITQFPNKTFPDTSKHHSQSILTNQLFGGFFVRLRHSQSGDYLGNYFDFGILVAASLESQLLSKDLFFSNDSNPFMTEKTARSVLKNINPFASCMAIRLGFDRFSLFATYLWTRTIKTKSISDLPALEIGFEISPIRY